MRNYFGEWAGEYLKMEFYIQCADTEKWGRKDYVWSLVDPVFDDRPYIVAAVWIGPLEVDYGGVYLHDVVAVEFRTEDLDADSFKLYRSYLGRGQEVLPYNGNTGRYQPGWDTRTADRDEYTTSQYVGFLIDLAIIAEMGHEHVGEWAHFGLNALETVQKRLGRRIWPQELEDKARKHVEFNRLRANLQKARSMPTDKHVYLIQHGDDRLYKIGISDTPERRVRTLSTGSPRPLRLVANKAHKYAGYVEKLLHRHFADWKVSGEWFEVPDEPSAQLLISFVTRDWAEEELGLPAGAS